MLRFVRVGLRDRIPVVKVFGSKVGTVVLYFFFFKGSGAPRDLPSSPTRRSSDLRDATRIQLLERGPAVSEIRHKTPIGAWDGGFAPGLDPARGDYASFASFSDPDGNSWVLQGRGYRNA